MAKFVLSAFADEYSPVFDEQLEGLKKNGVKFMEIRGVDGKNISTLTEEEMLAAKAKLDAAGIGVSSIGSPVGKIKVTDDFDAHIKVLENCIKAAKILGTKNIRIFSFYMPEGMTREEAAETLQITHQAVSSRLNRARKKLRAALEGCEEE